MKTLNEVLDVQSHQSHLDPAWKASGFGPTQWTTVKGLLNKNPVDMSDVSQGANIDIDFKQKLMQFFDTLGEIIVQDYPHDTSVFDIPITHTADGRRPADRVVGESFVKENADDWLENLKGMAASKTIDLGTHDSNFEARQKQIWLEENGLEPGAESDAAYESYRRIFKDQRNQNEAKVLSVAYDLISEAVLQEVGRLYEATVSIRGMQRNLKIFYPSMGVASRRQLQESLNKVLSGVVILKMSPMSEGGRITSTPMIMLEDAPRFQVAENVILDTETSTVIILEMKNCDKKKKKAKDIKKKASGGLVKEAFERYRTRLEEQLNKSKDAE